MIRMLATLLFAVSTIVSVPPSHAADAKKLVIVAGKPSHPPRMHEFNAGVQLLASCLKDVPDLKVEFVLNGWPKDESVFEEADAVVFYGSPQK